MYVQCAGLPRPSHRMMLCRHFNSTESSIKLNHATNLSFRSGPPEVQFHCTPQRRMDLFTLSKNPGILFFHIHVTSASPITKTARWQAQRQPSTLRAAENGKFESDNAWRSNSAIEGKNRRLNQPMNAPCTWRCFTINFASCRKWHTRG